MKLSPLFTIVIANYNHGKFIEEAILSVINQSYKNYELIIIDGGSTDNSVEVIKKYENKISWWVSEKDSGQSEAFNKGFKRATGQFLFWLNADDILLPNSLKEADNVISKNKEVEWVSANTVFFDVNGIVIKCTNGPSWSNFLFKNAPITVYGPTTIFSKKIFDEVGGFDESLRFGMDTDLWFRFKKLGHKFVKSQTYFWGFRIHKDSKTSHAFEDKQSDEFYKESKRIRDKNNVIYTRKGVYLQKIYKIFNGNYLKSLIDTNRNKGKSITNLKFHK